jgi:hypothetical protein
LVGIIRLNPLHPASNAGQALAPSLSERELVDIPSRIPDEFPSNALERDLLFPS